MKRSKKKALARQRRHRSIRRKVVGTPERPRLCVFRSLRHIYAQVIDDISGRTLAAASTLSPELRGQCDGASKTEAASLVGREIARRAVAAGQAHHPPCPAADPELRLNVRVAQHDGLCGLGRRPAMQRDRKKIIDCNYNRSQ